MQQAAELLLSTSLPILQIAALIGYESVSQFGVAFKQQYGMPPSQYQKIMVKKKV